MDISFILLVAVIITALAFDFTNGFHDTGNAMATSIATGALKPKTAVLVSAILNLVGAFLSIEVALTVTNSVIKIQEKTGEPKAELFIDRGYPLLLILLAGLAGAILWNLITWLLSLPSSSSHALFGGLIGATIASLGFTAVKWNGDSSKIDGVVGKIIFPALASPVIAALVAALSTYLVLKVTNKIESTVRDKYFRHAQIASASLVSLAHGTNDAQKTMGIITLALIGYGSHTDLASVPFWVKVVCALAIALGTYMGGWRIIRTLGKGIVEISPRQGFAAETASSALILSASHFGLPLSTTHVASGAIIGTGIGHQAKEIRWKVAGNMAMAWLTTLPAAAVMGMVMWFIGNLHHVYGIYFMVAVFLAVAFFIYRRSLATAVSHASVNDDWEKKERVGVALNEAQAYAVTAKKKKQPSLLMKRRKMK